MGLKKGDLCYRASFVGRKISYDEYVLRTIQNRRGKYSWEKPQTWAYWWAKIPGLSWGKRSKAHGDYGFLKDADPICREKHLLSAGRPYAATKAGAIRALAAETRSLIKDYGEDYDFDEEGVTLGQQLTAVLGAQKRLKARPSKAAEGVSARAEGAELTNA